MSADLERLSRTTRRDITVKDDHWIWTGKVSQGQPKAGPFGAARLIWQSLVFPPAPNEVCRRTCAEPLCVNPDHHEVKTGSRWA